MKKILIYLQSLVLTTTPLITVIACNKSKKTTKNKAKLPNELSEQEKEIIKNTSLFTKLLLLSRHENLNFNSTEVLNAVFTPKTTWTAFPRNYTIDGKTYNLIDYTEKLTTEYSNLSKFNSTDFDAFLASTLTGMYENKLYQDYVDQPTIKKNGVFKYIDADFNQLAKLSNNVERKQLAWANFTGPLSKYIIDKNVYSIKNEARHEEAWAIYHGRFLQNLKSENNIGDDVDFLRTQTGIMIANANDDPRYEIKEEFGQFQTKILYDQIKANFSAKILEFVPFIQNFNETATGANYGLKLLDNLFPFTDTKSNMDMTYVMFLLLQESIKWMKLFAIKYKSDQNAQEILKIGKELVGTLDSMPGLSGGLFKKTGIDFVAQLNHNTLDGFKVQMLMEDKSGNELKLFKAIKDFNTSTQEWVKDWNEDMKKQFLDHIKQKIDFFKKIAGGINESTPEFIQEGIKSLTSPDDVINLFTELGNMMGIIADNQQTFLDIAKNELYKDKDFGTLTKLQQQEIAIQFGFKDNKFEDGSVLKQLHEILNSKIINDLVLGHESPFYKYNSKNAKEIHQNLLQYALDDKYWTIDKESFKMNGAISGDKGINGKFSYSIEYKGKGDKTVTKFLDQPVKLPDNFNPIEPWYTPTDISTGWTKQDYIDYTGLGNDKFYDDVNFKYNVEWSNVSSNPEYPYWVITKVDCFKNESGKWKQFYPVI